MNSEHYIFRRTYFVICDEKKNEKLRKIKRKKKRRNKIMKRRETKKYEKK